MRRRARSEQALTILSNYMREQHPGIFSPIRRRDTWTFHVSLLLGSGVTRNFRQWVHNCQGDHFLWKVLEVHDVLLREHNYRVTLSRSSASILSHLCLPFPYQNITSLFPDTHLVYHATATSKGGTTVLKVGVWPHLLLTWGTWNRTLHMFHYCTSDV